WPRDWSSDVCSSDLDIMSYRFNCVANILIICFICKLSVRTGSTSKIFETSRTCYRSSEQKSLSVIARVFSCDDDLIAVRRQKSRSEERRVGKEYRYG